MLRAVPAMVAMAASTSRALRSFILTSAISRNCLLLMEPALSRLGMAEPLLRPAAFFNRSAAGVVILAELHQIDAVGAESRADGRGWVGLAALNLNLDYCFDFLCHFLLLESWRLPWQAPPWF